MKKMIKGLFVLLAPVMTWGYSTLDTGVSWSMDDLVANSGGAVTGTNFNYQLNENIFIKENDILRIASGTTITYDDAISWSALVVQGTLLARGTEDRSILFTFSELRGGVGDKDRPLEFSGSTGSSNSVLEWIICENADYGLLIKHSTPLTLKNCTFRNNNRGMYA